MNAREITPRDYIHHQAAQGVFSEDSAVPENDPRVLQTYLDLLEKDYPSESDFGIHLVGEKYGFFLDPVDNDRDGLNWALTTPVIDMCIGVSSDEFIGDLPRLRAEPSVSILTDSFSFRDGFGGDKKAADGVYFLNSPVADIRTDFPTYLDSLTSERRKKYRRMASDFDGAPLVFSLTDEKIAAADIDFIRSNLGKKWGEHAGYAFRQTLWFLAVQAVRPAQCLTMRVTDAAGVVFIQTMIVKDGHVTCQSIAKNEDKFYSGIAAYTDFKCVETLCGKAPYHTFDPSCRTSLNDPESIGVAKRATVNRNCRKPFLAIGENFDETVRNALASGTVLGREV